MTARQKYIMTKVEEKIRELRVMLDDVMYRTDKLSEEEYKRIREAYDHICEAADLL